MRNSKTDQTVEGMYILFLSSFSKSSAVIHQGLTKRPDKDERHSIIFLRLIIIVVVINTTNIRRLTVVVVLTNREEFIRSTTQR